MIAYIPHGGGPLPLLGDAGHTELAEHLVELAATLARPAAIVVVSAHWEAQQASLTAGEQPELIYDYSGFPPESYSIQYPAPGTPELAAELAGALTRAGIGNSLEQQRGFDHGLFVPLKLMYPDADIPCVQLSLLSSLDAAAHIELGKACRGVLGEDVLVLGSGFSFHNMRAFFHRGKEDDDNNAAFQSWLIETCADASLEESERERRLADWQQAPHARFCHPREEHLLPLQVCYGLAGRAADVVEQVTVLGKRACTFVWR